MISNILILHSNRALTHADGMFEVYTWTVSLSNQKSIKETAHGIRVEFMFAFS